MTSEHEEAFSRKSEGAFQRALNRSVGWIVLLAVLGGAALTSDRNMAWILEQFATASELQAKAQHLEKLADGGEIEAKELIAKTAEDLRSGKLLPETASEELGRAHEWLEAAKEERETAAVLRSKAARKSKP